MKDFAYLSLRLYLSMKRPSRNKNYSTVAVSFTIILYESHHSMEAGIHEQHINKG